MDAASNTASPAVICLRDPRTVRGRETDSCTLAPGSSASSWGNGAPSKGDQELHKRIAELVALNRQLQEALERQRQISDALRVTSDHLAAARPGLCRQDAAARAASLTPRQRQIMDLVLAGHRSKNIAADLGINQRTVENHRAAIMKKMGVASLAALVRVGLAAA
jgi:DNA-binding NarL/FixJ family response regulator